MKALRPVASRLVLRSEHRSAQQTSTQTQRNGTGRRGRPWRPLRMRTETAPAACRGRSCRNWRPGWLMGTSRTRRSSCTQVWVRPPSLSWPAADAYSQPAYCGRPQPASRVAQPWSLRVRAWVVAIVSWAVCGDAGGRIKPLWPSCPRAQVAEHSSWV